MYKQEAKGCKSYEEQMHPFLYLKWRGGEAFDCGGEDYCQTFL